MYVWDILNTNKPLENILKIYSIDIQNIYVWYIYGAIQRLYVRLTHIDIQYMYDRYTETDRSNM
jgi:hypothetical protein